MDFSVPAPRAVRTQPFYEQCQIQCTMNQGFTPRCHHAGVRAQPLQGSAGDLSACRARHARSVGRSSPRHRGLRSNLTGVRIPSALIAWPLLAPAITAVRQRSAHLTQVLIHSLNERPIVVRRS